MLVDARALVQEIVGADQRGVAGHVAAAEPTTFEHGHIRDAVVARQIMGGGQTVPAAADDHHIVVRFGFGVVPQEVWMLWQVCTGGCHEGPSLRFLVVCRVHESRSR